MSSEHHRFGLRAGALLAAILFTGCATSHEPIYPIDFPITKAEQMSLLVEHHDKYGIHEQADLNHDGSQDRDEHRRVEWLYRTQFDLNKDNQLSWIEWLLGKCPIPSEQTLEKSRWFPEECARYAKASFNRLERNGDGLISYEEARPTADYRFSRFDLCLDRKYRPEC